MPDNVKLVHTTFVESCEREFDLMIVENGAKPIGFAEVYPCAYPKTHVRLLIEVKASGLYYPNKTFEEDLTCLFQRIQERIDRPFIYLSIWESRPKAKMTRKTLGNSAFILKEGKDPVPDEWQRFVSKVCTYLKRY